MSEEKEQKGFSWMAFFFAPYYYAGYGKFPKGLLYAIIGFIPLTSLIVNIYAGTKAKKELPIGKEDFKWLPAIAMYIIHAAIWLTVFSFSPMAERENKTTTLENVSGVWLTDSSNELIKVDFRNKNKYLEINQVHIPIQIANIDNENHTISFKISFNNNILIWTLQQIFDEENKFHLNLISHVGKSEKLSYVRNIIDETNNKNSIKDVKQSNVKIIDKLYPEVLIDYIGVSEKKLVQDFGEAFEVNDAGGEGRILAGLTLENHLEYIYKFSNDILTFYIDKNNGKSSAIQIEIGFQSNTKIKIPYLVNNEPKIILGKSTFQDLFSIGEPKDCYVNGGGTYPGSTYAECTFYFGRYGNYKTYSFGTHSFGSIEEARKNYKVLAPLKPDYVIIKD